ncbi:gamma-glutamyltransferase (plasmid) [Rhodobacteraceae bacterium M382]|nr:gamma-glutamyltransferase [Rhodobacteraceae bacterium M382]
MRNLELPGRSPVIATTAVAATSHHLATQTAIAILQKGGNAMDAAIAACAVQCVVEPQSTGIGGDCFCMYAPKGSDDYVAFNGSGRAPAAATPEWFAEQGITRIQQQSAHAVTIPGAVDAWDTLHRDHGVLPFADVLQPAIDYAQNGYPIASRVSVDFARNLGLLQGCEHASRVFLPGGQSVPEGHVHKQPDLGRTLEKIATQGRDGFYTSDVAEDMVTFLQGHGGLHTMEDFANVQGDYVTPIKARYHGYDVYQCPPNGQGVIALMLLKLMERFEKEGDTPINLDRIHQEIEAGRLTYHQRDCYVADPEHAQVPVEWLLSDENIDNLYNTIQADQALTEMPDFTPPVHHDTVYITVVDKDRNACSFINTLFHNFGTGLMAPRSGVLLHCRGMGFSLDSEHPNCIAPNKRPLHTIIPGMVAKDGKTVMSYGVMGGAYQAFGHMQFLSRFLQYGFDIQEAQDLPRFFPNPITGNIDCEGTLPDDITEDLRARGHRIAAAKVPIGGSQAIWIDWDKGTLTGGSDPRKDGCAAGY